MATKRDLQNYVNELNKKYCKNTKNHFRISHGYGGYAVELTGKQYKRGANYHYINNSLGGRTVNVGNSYHDTATNTLKGLYNADSKGLIREVVKRNEPRKR